MMDIMADQDDVRRIALSLPETSESGLGFRVRNASAKSGSKQFAWACERDPGLWRTPACSGQPVRRGSRHRTSRERRGE